MTNLRFKEYTFRHNPRKIVVKCGTGIARKSCFAFGERMQTVGRSLKVVEGEGELFGADAMEQFSQLQKLMYGGSGILSGAGLEPMKALMESLQLIGRGGDETISYTFRFIEDRGEQ